MKREQRMERPDIFERRPFLWIMGLMVLLGIAGLVTHQFRTFHASSAFLARGSFWEGRNSSGRPLTVEDKHKITLTPGATLHLPMEGAADTTYTSFSFSGIRNKASSSLEIIVEEEQGGELSLLVASAATQGLLLKQKNQEGQILTLAQDKKKDYLVPLSKSIRVHLKREQNRIGVKIDGKEILNKQSDLNPWKRIIFRAKNDSFTIQEIRTTGRAGGSEFSLVDDLSSLERTPWLPWMGSFLIKAGLFLACLGFYLRALCLGPPPFRRLVRAVTLALLPASFYGCTGLIRSVEWWSPMLLLLFPLGLILALFSLKGHIRISVPEGLVGKILSLLVSLAALGITVHAAATYRTLFYSHSLQEEQAAQQKSSPPPHRVPEIQVLGPHNACTINRSYRNMDLKARVTLAPGAIFQARIRAPALHMHRGVSLFLSADPRFKTGFYLETLEDFKLMGSSFRVPPAQTSLDLWIKARGRDFEALLDGKSIASARERIFAEGYVVLLAAKGSATVENIGIDPCNFNEPGVSTLPDVLLGAAMPLLFLLLYVPFASLFLGIRFVKVLEAGIISLLPVALCFYQHDPSGLLQMGKSGVMLSLAGFLFLVYLMVHARHLKAVKYLVLLCLIVGGTLMAFLIARERAWPPDSERVGRLSLAEWSGERLEADLVHLQHPLLRRMNHYLARHTFRKRSHALEKKPGTSRIVSLGTSSTYGHWVKAPYPLRLERTLKEEGFDVEGINGACRGGTGMRQYYFFRNVLLDFSPDIVTLSLFLNDAYALSQMDEAAYLNRVIAQGYTRSGWDRLRDRIQVWQGAARVKALSKKDPDPLVEMGSDSPPARFKKMLEAFATLAKSHDIRLVLIKEPLAGGKDYPWKGAFYKVMDEVGASFGLPVVDPTPLLNAKGGARLFRDIVHPYDEGDAVVAEALLPVIRKMLENGEKRDR
jgi:hypothetical protein